MAKLVMKFKGQIIDHIELTQGDMKIGRRASCDIFLDNLAISGEHANLFTIGEDSFVQDLNSTNGTYVNNKKITKHHLQSGDEITIGKHTFVYFADDEVQPPKTEDFAKTVIIDPNSSNPELAAAKLDSLADTIAMAPKKDKDTRQGAIFVLSGANSGKRIELVKTITNLGKTGKVAGTIKRESDGYTLGPSNAIDPPKLNGRPLRENEQVPLKNGDIIEVAGTRLQFYLK